MIPSSNTRCAVAPDPQPAAEWLAQQLADLPLLRHPSLIIESALFSLVQVLAAPAGYACLIGENRVELHRGTLRARDLGLLQRGAKQLRRSPGAPAVSLPTDKGRWLCAPIAQGGTYVGQVAVRLDQPGSGGEAHLIEVTAAAIGGALGIGRELGVFRQEAERLNLIYQIAHEIHARLDIHALLDEIMRRGQQALAAEACSVILLDPERNELVFEVAHGEAGEELREIRMPANAGIAGWIVTHGEPLIVDDVRSDPRFYQNFDQSSGFQTRSILGVPLWARGRTIGVIEVLNKRDGTPFDQADLDLLNLLSAQAAISIDNARLYESVTRGYFDTVRALAAAVDAKDQYTAGHSGRVGHFSELAASGLDLTPEEASELRYAAVLHDVGKIGIDDAVIRKKSGLTPAEFTVMKTHPDLGAKIIGNIKFLARAKLGVRHHHEQFDGSGYPAGLAGRDIPIIARIIAVGDAYDAMTTERPYRRAIPHEAAVPELRVAAGSHFDPEVVESFIAAVSRERAARLARRVDLVRVPR